MKNAEATIRRIFFYGAFVLAALAVVAKIANLLNITLINGLPEPYRLLEIAAIGLLFSIAMQLSFQCGDVASHGQSLSPPRHAADVSRGIRNAG